MDNSEIHELLGRLAERTEETKGMISAVLHNQELSRVDLKEHVGRDDERFEKMGERFDRIDLGLGDLRDRIKRSEAMVDTVEIHGETIAELESRISARDKIEEIRSAVKTNNLKWLGAAGAAGAAAGAAGHGMWPRIWKFFAEFLK